MLLVLASITYFNRVSFANDGNVTLQVTFDAAIDVFWVCQHCPFVVELVVCQRKGVIIENVHTGMTFVNS